jgi:hypothetical protein
MAVVVGAYAWFVTGLPPFSTAATVAVVGSGALVATGSGLRRRVACDDVVTPKPATAWCALAVAVAAWQINALVRHPRAEHPTLSSLANVVLEPRPVRMVAFMGWLAGAAWLARS